MDKELTHSSLQDTDKIKRTLGYYITYALCYFCIGILLAWGSQFIIGEEVLKRLASRLASPTVAWFFYPASEDPQRIEKITVLAMDDDDLDEYKQTYPVPYSFHAQRLNSISLYPPKSIFIDIWFHDKRDDPSIAQFVDAICNLHKNGTRVYLAILSPDGTEANSLRPELNAITAMATGPGSIADKPDACAVAVSVDKDVDPLDRQSWKYDLVSGVDDSKIFSAAAQMYSDLPDHKPLTLSAPPLALIWGVKGAEINEKAIGSQPGEEKTCRNEWYRVEILPLPAALKSSMHQLFSNSDIDKPFCAYHTTLPFRALKLLPPEITAPLLSDRLVIYGSNLQSMDDVVYSPVHGRLAGLHMHAMALDNLLKYEESYPQAGEFWHSDAATKFSLFVVAILSLIMTFLHWYQYAGPTLKCRIKLRIYFRKCRKKTGKYFQKSRKKNKKSPANSTINRLKNAYAYTGLATFFQWVMSWVKKVFLSIGMLCLMAWLGLKFFHLGPLSWMEYAAAPAVLHLLHLGENMTQYFHPKFVDAGEKLGWITRDDGHKMTEITKGRS